MEEREYSVSETVRLVGVESHVLRYWEEELHLTIRRNSQGHRIYSDGDIGLLCLVRELKEKGLQLRAIRLLLEEQDGEQTDRELREKLRPILGEPEGEASGEVPAAREAGRTGGDEYGQKLDGSDKYEPEAADEAEEFPVCEVVRAEDAQDYALRFEQILREMVEDVVSEQNGKLEKAITESVREEIFEFCLRYHRMMREAAASAETGRRRPGRLREMLRRLFGGGE